MGRVRINEAEVELHAIHASGPGGQNVNKVATAIQLRFDIHGSSLPDTVKQRLLSFSDKRITADGEIIIKAQRYRSQEKNRSDALQRLQQLVDRAATPRRKRIATKPGRAAIERRLKEKKKTGHRKATRGRVKDLDQ